MRMKRKINLFIVLAIITLFFSSTAYARKDQYIKDDDFVNTGFFSDYSGILEDGDVEWVQLKEGVRLGNYSKIIILNFSSSSTKAHAVSLKREMPDMFANTLSGIFGKIERLDQEIGPKDYDKIKALPADAVIMGNIKKIVERDAAKQFWVGFGAGEPNVYLEFKMVDTKTGEEILRIVHDESSRSSTSDSAAQVVEGITEYIEDHK